MITTTLNRIRAHKPCGMDPREKPLEGFCKLRAALGPDYGDDTPIPFARIAKINGLDDAIWCCRVEPQHAKVWRLYAVWCARQVEHLMTDQRPRDALDVAERHADGLATDAELNTAWAAAGGAVRNAGVAMWDAAEAAAGDAAWAAAEAAVWAAAWAAREATWAAREATRAARDAARADAEAAQTARFIEMVGGDDDEQK